MKNILLLLVCIPFLNLQTKADDYHVRFAFMGNSITIGTFLANPQTECYPAQFSKMLEAEYGDTCIVKNFAVSGRTMLKNGDFPLWNEPQFKQSMDFAPDIVYIMLGTNDTKPYNWDDHGAEFIADYQSMIDTFLWRNPRCKFILAYPPPAFAVNFDIRNDIIVNEVLPALDSILKTNDALSIDYYHAFLDSSNLFPDAIHPNAKGAKAMAQLLFNHVKEADIVHEVETGFTYATGINSSASKVAKGSEFTLSWTSRNADSVYVNGVKAEVNGNLSLTILENTSYTITAFGPKNNDELTFYQETYEAELTKLKAERSESKIEVGDTSRITVTFVDQFNQEITNDEFELNWELIEGEGELINPSTNAITLLGTAAGTVRVRASVGDLEVISRINVTNKTSVDEYNSREFTVFPNPSKGDLIIECSWKGAIKYSMFSSGGQLMISGQLKHNKIEFSHLNKGVYFLQLESTEGRAIQKVIIN